MSVNITNKTVSDKMVRERTFDISMKRSDRKDALAQIIVTLDQLLEQRITGRIIIDCNLGGINNIRVQEEERVRT